MAGICTFLAGYGTLSAMFVIMFTTFCSTKPAYFLAE
jgi:hypothetical protein